MQLNEKDLDIVRQLGLLRESTNRYSKMTKESMICKGGPNLVITYKGFTHFNAIHTIMGTLNMSETTYRVNSIIISTLYVNGIRCSTSTSSISRTSNIIVEFDKFLNKGDYLVEIVVNCSSRDVEYWVNNAKIDIIRRMHHH